MVHPTRPLVAFDQPQRSVAWWPTGGLWLFWIGFFFPVLWIVGGLIGATPRAAARAGGVA